MVCSSCGSKVHACSSLDCVYVNIYAETRNLPGSVSAKLAIRMQKIREFEIAKALKAVVVDNTDEADGVVAEMQEEFEAKEENMKVEYNVKVSKMEREFQKKVDAKVNKQIQMKVAELHKEFNAALESKVNETIALKIASGELSIPHPTPDMLQQQFPCLSVGMDVVPATGSNYIVDEDSFAAASA